MLKYLVNKVTFQTLMIFGKKMENILVQRETKGGSRGRGNADILSSQILTIKG